MTDEIKKYLFDILESAKSIEEYVGPDLNFKNYQSNKMLRRAVEREFEIIGEALKSIDRINPDLEISGKRQIIGMRNRVIHGYDKIDNEILWGAIVKHLPKLRFEVEHFLSE